MNAFEAKKMADSRNELPNPGDALIETLRLIKVFAQDGDYSVEFETLANNATLKNYKEYINVLENKEDLSKDLKNLNFKVNKAIISWE